MMAADRGDFNMSLKLFEKTLRIHERMLYRLHEEIADTWDWIALVHVRLE